MSMSSYVDYYQYYVRLAQVAQFAVDVIFVVDASRSIGSVIFAQTKFFVSQLIDYFDVDGGLVRVGACSYSASIRSSFNLNAHSTVAGVKAAVLALSYSGGSANTAAALAYVRTRMLTSAAGDRGSVPNLIVILTDGPSTNPVGARVSATKRFSLIALFSWFLLQHRTVAMCKNKKLSYRSANRASASCFRFIIMLLLIIWLYGGLASSANLIGNGCTRTSVAYHPQLFNAL